MNKKILVTLALGLTLGLSSISAKGFEKDGDRMSHHQFGDMKMMMSLKSIDLTKEQKEKIKDLFEDKKEQKNDDLVKLFSEKGFDKKAYIDMMSNKRDNMLKSKAQMIEDVYAILTDEQKKQFIENLKKGPEKFKGQKGDKDCHDRR